MSAQRGPVVAASGSSGRCAVDVGTVDVGEERSAAIRLCLYAVDRARSIGVADRLLAGLADLGVTAVRPDGEVFDPARHEAGSTVPTDDPRLHGTVAATELMGFADRGRLVRVPVVAVYTGGRGRETDRP